MTTERKTKRRLHSVILVSAMSAVACGGKAQGNENDRSPSERSSGDGDGDAAVEGTGGALIVGVPVGDWVGEPIGDYPVGVPPDYVGEPPNYCNDFPDECIGAPPIDGTGGGTSMGGMGGQSGDEDELVGTIR